MASTFDSVDPATGEVVATFPIHTADEVRAAVTEARAAAKWWQGLGSEGRKRRLIAWRRLLARRIDELSALMHKENGKPVGDALAEAAVAIEHLHWAATNADRVLGRRRVRPGMLAINHRASVEYVPFGVVGVIGPWNYPVHTPLGSISYALAAGNAVVFKPSEYTPAVGAWLADTFAEAVPDRPVFQVVTGFGETGAALARSGVDKLAFTGSAATGRKVMAACAETLTPVVIEGGGKDALVVAEDADLDAAADAAVWGGISNAGQSCVGIERVYAVDAIHDDLLERIARAAGRLRQGDAYGPMTMPAQRDVVRAHVEDALARGARAVVGGAESVGERYVDPIVLAGVPEDAPAVQQETFGPTLTVTRVRDVDEAVERANATRYGLGAAVFSARHGEAIAARLRCGMVSVNSALTFATVPGLPFGGVGESGFGRIHGADGLREFARPRAVTVQRFRPPIRVATYRRPRSAFARLRLLVKLRYGGR